MAIFYEGTPKVPNNHILSKILTYIITILQPSTILLGPLETPNPGSSVRPRQEQHQPDPGGGVFESQRAQ